MTKEEIRGSLFDILDEVVDDYYRKAHPLDTIAERIIERLDSKGVVLKKEFVPPYLPSVVEAEKQILAIVERLI